MADERVQIIYEAIVKGQEKLEALARQNQDLVQQNEHYKKRLDEVTQAQDKQETSLKKASIALRSFRREMFILSFTAAAAVGTLKLLATQSEILGAKLERLGDTLRSDLLNPLGNMAASVMGFLAPIGSFISKTSPLLNVLRFFKTGAGSDVSETTRATRIQQKTLESQIALLKGDRIGALEAQQAAERIKILEDENDQKIALFGKYLNEKHALEKRALQLTILGLKQEHEIREEFIRESIGALRGGVSQTVFGFLQGERQTGSEILKNFTTGLNRAISEAFSQALFTSLAGGGGFLERFKSILTGNTPQNIAAKNTADNTKSIMATSARANELLEQIARCVCATGEAIVNRPGATLGQKGQAIANLVGSISGAAAFFSPKPEVKQGAPAPPGHSGGFVGSFQSGGEVPILAQPGEFIVRRSATQENRDLLRDINSGGSKVRGTTNVFLIRANDAASFSQMLASPSARAQMEIQMIKAVMSNGQLRKIISQYAR